MWGGGEVRWQRVNVSLVQGASSFLSTVSSEAKGAYIGPFLSRKGSPSARASLKGSHKDGPPVASSERCRGSRRTGNLASTGLFFFWARSSSLWERRRLLCLFFFIIPYKCGFRGVRYLPKTDNCTRKRRNLFFFYFLVNNYVLLLCFSFFLTYISVLYFVALSARVLSHSQNTEDKGEKIR